MKTDYVSNAKTRVFAIRTRTWTLTLALIASLFLLYVVDLCISDSFDIIDFILLAIIQIVAHCIYFPDGDAFGQKDSSYILNKTAYDEKASRINEERKIGKLRKYCKFEFEERKTRYLENECGALGISLAELETLRDKDEKYIMSLEHLSIGEGDNEKLLFFPKHKRKRLCRLLFGSLPIEENQPETILGAVENNGCHAIKDGSNNYKKMAYARKILMAIFIGGLFAYLTYKVKDGFGIAEITSIVMSLTAIFTTAVTSFTSGETCSRVYRKHFYVDLINFIDCFNEWTDESHAQSI